MRIVKTREDLAEELRQVRAAGRISDAALRQQFQTFRMELPDGVPSDPDSEAYRQWQFDLYASIARKPYDTANERTPFDPATMVDKPFPFLNEGWEVTGDQLIAVGWLFKAMRLPPGASILEFGPGWGNTTLALAQNGYRVTAIEIEANFIALIAARAKRLNVVVDVRQGDFLDAAALGQRFDAVLFFESFHHCANHQRLLDLLPGLMTDDGIAVFAAEPIDEGFAQPWGLRLDGQSLWAIRSNGWLELGFTESYFIAQLMRRGFVVERRRSDASPLATCLIARKAHGRYTMATFLLPPDEDRSWAIAESDPAARWRFTGAESTLTIERGGAFSRLTVAMRNFAPISLPVEVTFGARRHRAVIPPHTERSVDMPYDPAGERVTILAHSWRPADHPGMGDDARRLGVSVASITLA